MYSKIRSLLALALISVAVSACNVERIEVPADELYAREFIKQIGIIDSKQDCNMAVRGVVTVMSSKPADLKVLADVNGKRYLFADYKNVSGTQEVSFDIPREVKDVIVRTGNRNHVVRLGSTLNLDRAGSRTINSSTDDGSPVSYYPKEDQRVFNGSILSKFAWNMPRNGNTNYQKAISDYSFISEANKEMTIYPVDGKFYITNSSDKSNYYSHCLGIYWLNEEDNGKIRKENMRDLYYGYTEELTYVVTNSDGSQVSIKKPRIFEFNSFMTEKWYDNVEVTTRGITYKFAESGIKYGFYVKFAIINDKSDANLSILDPKGASLPKKFDYVHFSQAYLNEIFGTENGIVDENGLADYQIPVLNNKAPTRQSRVNSHSWGSVSDSKYKHVAACFKPIEYSDGTTRLFFAFEDGQNDSYFDLADIVFMFDEATVPVVYDEIAQATVALPGQTVEPDYEPYEWLIAAEDLGGINDFDFNDLVVSVKYNAVKDGSSPEYTDVTITPLAAGGTLPIYLMYDGRLGDDATEKTYVIGSECHLWLGGGDSTTPINVYGAVTHICPEDKEVCVRVPGQFSLASHINNSKWENNMGGFWLLVDPEEQFGEDSHTYKATSLFPESARKVQPPMQGEGFTAPQMICVGTAWEWPSERSSIQTTYHNFTNWLNGSLGEGESWYGSAEHHNGNVISRKH